MKQLIEAASVIDKVSKNIELPCGIKWKWLDPIPGKVSNATLADYEAIKQESMRCAKALHGKEIDQVSYIMLVQSIADDASVINANVKRLTNELREAGK